jgi:hypothetical protein
MQPFPNLGQAFEPDEFVRLESLTYEPRGRVDETASGRCPAGHRPLAMDRAGIAALPSSGATH